MGVRKGKTGRTEPVSVALCILLLMAGRLMYPITNTTTISSFRIDLHVIEANVQIKTVLNFFDGELHLVLYLCLRG